MDRIIFSFLLVLASSYSDAQIFEPYRVTDWSKAGAHEEISVSSNLLNITDFGADNTGTLSCNQAYQAAIQDLNGTSGIIYFPEGTYFFDGAIAIPDSVTLQGESFESELRFDLGGSGNLIVINGSIGNQQYDLAQNATKGTFEIELNDASDFEEGDVIRLGCFDEDLMFSSWAYGTLGQVLIIEEKDGNILRFDDPINHNFPISRTPYVRKITPRRAAGIQCLSIERLDATSSQTSNIYIRNAVNCTVQNVTSANCNFAHVEVNSSTHITIEGGYFHHAFAYGGGGQGYGVVFQETSSFNLAQNNIFEHLRHSMLMQSGANGNVYGYNYSYDPFWEGGFLPSNSAGDAVLHGNYVYLNLFEGNTIQNIVVDASHGSNGPYNTFLRNRAELYGFFSDSGTPTDSMNVVGNEITNSGFPYGMFSINGLGHYSYGNNVNGTVTPANTSSIQVNSLCLDEQTLPPFLSSETLPLAGYPLTLNEKLLPAEQRFSNQTYVECSSPVITNLNQQIKDSPSSVSLRGNKLMVAPRLLNATLRVFSVNGVLIFESTINSTEKTMPNDWSNGVYLIQVLKGIEIHNIKVLISR